MKEGCKLCEKEIFLVATRSRILDSVSIVCLGNFIAPSFLKQFIEQKALLIISILIDGVLLELKLLEATDTLCHSSMISQE